MQKLRKLSKIDATCGRPMERAKRELPCSRWPHGFHGIAAARCQRNLQSVLRQRAARVVETRRPLLKDARLASIRQEALARLSALPLSRSVARGFRPSVFTSRTLPINLQLVPTRLRCMAFSPLYSCIDEIDGLRVAERLAEQRSAAGHVSPKVERCSSVFQ